jgi:glycosyltransferase involved in cell wall biosynthesis
MTASAMPVRTLPAKDAGSCPFWSVMVPTYRPDQEYLRQALESVLQQDPGPEQMQIEVVDDCSPEVDVETMVRSIAGDRVTASRTPKNLGLAGGWNTCIERARGQWVHILHQDDFVLNGFYAALQMCAASNEPVGAAFCRYVRCDQDGHWLILSELHRKEPGTLDGWLERLGGQQLIQTPSIVVKKSTYKELGGFRSDLCYALDWEMWLRIGTRFSFWFEPRILAAYRAHQASETSRLERDAADVRDIRRMLEITASYQKPHLAPRISRQAGARYADLAVLNARRLLVLGHADSAWKQLIEAFRLTNTPHMWKQGASLLFLWARVAGARLKRRVKASLRIS